MNKILSVSVTPKQYEIVQKIAQANKMTISHMLKESLRTYIALYYVGDMLDKMKLEPTMENIERNSMIITHAEEMVKLMQPYLEKALTSIPDDVIKELENEGIEISNTIQSYDKTVKRGRPPLIITKKGDNPT